MKPRAIGEKRSLEFHRGVPAGILCFVFVIIKDIKVCWLPSLSSLKECEFGNGCDATVELVQSRLKPSVKKLNKVKDRNPLPTSILEG